MGEKDLPDRQPQQQESRYFDWMIPLAGFVLVLFATAMFGLFPRSPNNVIIAIALFGVGCAALWFGLTHSEAQKTQSRIKAISDKAERVRDLLDKSKK